MNSSSPLLSGLLSSLLLSLGFSRLAARFDLLEKSAAANIVPAKDQQTAAFSCAMPCRWQEV